MQGVPWGPGEVGRSARSGSARSVGAAESRAVGAVGRRGRSARAVGAVGRPGRSAPGGAGGTFEADPIGRRLECRPKKGINIVLIITHFQKYF